MVDEVFHILDYTASTDGHQDLYMFCGREDVKIWGKWTSLKSVFAGDLKSRRDINLCPECVKGVSLKLERLITK